MGLSTSKSTQTSNNATTQTGTTTPQNPSWVTDSLMNYTGRIGSMLDADPNSFVAGASPLQQQAWGNADRLGQWGANNNTASQIALGAANAPASTVPGAAGYTAAQGGASTYSPATLANPREATATGYNAAQAGGVNIDPTVNGQASNAHAASLLSGLSNYMSPYRDQVVNSTLADYDHNSGVQRAALEAQGAKAGAFGGSRFGIAQGELLGNQARGRATTEAGLLNDMFTTGAGLSQSDAANRQQTSLFNAQNQTGVSQANAAAANARAASQAGLTANLGVANMGAQNEAAAAAAAAQNTASLANQAGSNQFALTQAGMQTDAAKYAADANNANTQGYLGRADQAASQNAAGQNAASLFNAQSTEAGLNRQLGAANQLNAYGNDYGANTRADLGAMASLGDQQRSIEQAYALSPLAQLQAGGQLFGANPWQIFNGQTVNTNGTSNGTTTTTQSPNLFQMLMQGAQTAAQAYAGGAG